MMTSASLLHPHMDGEPFLHIGLYVVALVCALCFASYAIPLQLGPLLPMEEARMNWLQLGFVVVQQMCYFGVHGISLKSES